MKKPAESLVELHPILANRWSPRSFDPSHEVTNSDLTGILEAARWSPSASNSQPWRFLIARRGEECFDSISKLLAGFNAAWAPSASLYILVATQTINPDGTARPYALYDAGIASANATTEAHHRGLAVHQIAGFDKDAIAKEFNFEVGLRPLTILVVGKQAPAETLADQVLRDREAAARERLPLNDLVINSDEFVS
jgi:nitroreductase